MKTPTYVRMVDMNKVKQYKNSLLGRILGPEPLLLAIIGYDGEHRPIAGTLLVAATRDLWQNG